MMKRSHILILGGICVLFAVGLAAAKDNDGPMTGTWGCQAKGGSEGDTTFTLHLEQNGQGVEGSVSSPMGDAQISSGTFKGDVLEIHIDSSEANYLLKAKFDKGELTGTWLKDGEKQGTWGGKKQVAAAK